MVKGKIMIIFIKAIILVLSGFASTRRAFGYHLVDDAPELL